MLPMSSRRSLPGALAVVALAALLVAPAPHAAGRRPTTDADLLKFTWIADPQMAPDGTAVAFVRVVVNEKGDGYDSAIDSVSVAGGDPRRLTAGVHDTAPRWSPDGTHLVFVRAKEEDGKQQPPQIYALDMSGGEARQITDLPKGASAPAWSPDGRTIAFLSSTSRQDLDAQRAKREGGPNAGQPENDVKVITRAAYRENGEPGFLDDTRHAHVWTVVVGGGAAPAEPKQVTSGDFDENAPAWSRDGAYLYFTSTRIKEEYYQPSHSELYRVPSAGGDPVSVAAIDGTVDDFSVSPDGRQIAFVGTLNGTPVRSYSEPDLWITGAAPGSRPRNLTADYDYGVGETIGGDQEAPRGGHPTPIVWTADSLAFVAAERGDANLERIPQAGGAVSAVTRANATVMEYTATPDGRTMAAVVSTPTSLGDLFLVGRDRPLTHFNDALFGELQQSTPEEFTYRSFDGRQIQGWILKPPDFASTKKYPAILEIHGGPHTAYGNVYMHEFQALAARGYVVLYTNPRGSSAYGQEFGNIIQYRYPGDDYKDLMAGVDALVARGYVDPNRLGVTGGSGGGLLTNWAITQTTRFKAAVAQRDIADWYGFWFTADFTQFVPFWFHKAPWEAPEEFAARSPITHVANVTTPLMLVLGDEDYRTPPADGGEMMFRALKYRKVPTVMVRFPRENHELSRSGEPRHRVERLRHIGGWMDRWLQGKAAPEYEVR